MLHFNFAFNNPFSNRFLNLFTRMGQVYKTKYWELECYRSNVIVELGFNVTTRCDHAGFDLTIGLLGHTIHFQVYDNRHWNYKEDRWMFYTEEKGLH